MLYKEDKTKPSGMDSKHTMAELHEIVGDDYYKFWIKVKIKDEILPWVSEGDTCSADFRNTVTATAPGLNESATQTQTVTKNKYENVIQKSGSQGSSNVIPYTIAINPEGMDLMEGKDNLMVTDTLEYQDSAVFGADLVPGSVEVFVMERDGTRGEKIEAPYKYKNRAENSKRIHVLRITIPDGKPLLVSYSYRFYGTLKETEVVSNRAKWRVWSPRKMIQ